MKISGALLLVLALFASPAVAGEECSSVDLRPLIGKALHQGDSGYCFAHTSASLIQAKLGFAVSPMQLASNYILANPGELAGAADPEVRGMITPDLIKFWRHDRNVEPQNFTSAAILGENGLINTGGDEIPTILAANFLGLCAAERLPTGELLYKKYLDSVTRFHRARVKQGIPPSELTGEIGEVLEPEARTKAWSFRQWIAKRCGTLTMPRVPLIPRSVVLAKNIHELRVLESMHLISPLAVNNVVQAIDRAIESGRPVSIGYTLADLMPEKVTAGAAEVDHVSVVAARKKISGRCYYYVRNSFGEETDGYLPKFRGRIHQGGVWVLPEELPSLYSAVWLE